MDDEQIGSEIAFLIREINAKLNRQLREAFKEHHLTPPQMIILFMLSEEKRLKVSDISKKMNLANSTVSGILDRLERHGYIHRKRDDEDKRVVHIVASEQVKEFQQSLDESVAQILQAFVKGATETEIDQVMEGLRILRRLLTTNDVQAEEGLE